MSTVKVNAITDASGGNTTTINSMTPTADSLQGFRNRIINGAMVIDQRNAGASVTFTNTVAYCLDRYRVVALGTSLGFSVQRSTTVPSGQGFVNSLLATVTTAKSVASTDQTRIDQFIEGFNVADLGFGTASAKTVILSFWVRSSVTGTYCIQVGNGTSPTRSYIAEYSISAANTWERKTITITGDTTGTWNTDNSVGLGVSFVLGMGSSFNGSTGWQAGEKFQTTNQTQWINNSGATFYITGVQLEVGSTATPFERRPYGTELMLCQRYFFKLNSTYTGGGFGGADISGNNALAYYKYPVDMRANPTVTQTGTIQIASGGTTTTKTSITSTDAKLSYMRMLWDITGNGFTSGYASHMDFVSGTVQEITVSAEL